MIQLLLKACLYGLIITGFVGFPAEQNSSISGKISPADAPESIWAIMGTDSVRTVANKDGNFQLNTKPGSWKLLIFARQPYRNGTMERVEVTLGNNTDVGEIRLEKIEKR